MKFRHATFMGLAAIMYRLGPMPFEMDTNFRRACDWAWIPHLELPKFFDWLDADALMRPQQPWEHPWLPLPPTCPACMVLYDFALENPQRYMPPPSELFQLFGPSILKRPYGDVEVVEPNGLVLSNIDRARGVVTLAHDALPAKRKSRRRKRA